MEPITQDLTRTPVMDPEIKSRWLAALRSGDYLQGMSRLKTIVDENTRYCCLGVLCELAAAEGIVTETEKVRPVFYPGTVKTMAFGEQMNVSILPPEVAEWSGLDGLYDYTVGKLDEETPSLAMMNDNGDSFVNIAMFIEKNF